MQEERNQNKRSYTNSISPSPSSVIHNVLRFAILLLPLPNCGRFISSSFPSAAHQVSGQMFYLDPTRSPASAEPPDRQNLSYPVSHPPATAEPPIPVPQRYADCSCVRCCLENQD